MIVLRYPGAGVALRRRAVSLVSGRDERVPAYPDRVWKGEVSARPSSAPHGESDADHDDGPTDRRTCAAADRHPPVAASGIAGDAGPADGAVAAPPGAVPDGEEPVVERPGDACPEGIGGAPAGPVTVLGAIPTAAADLGTSAPDGAEAGTAAVPDSAVRSTDAGAEAGTAAVPDSAVRSTDAGADPLTDGPAATDAAPAGAATAEVAATAAVAAPEAAAAPTAAAAARAPEPAGPGVNGVAAGRMSPPGNPVGDSRCRASDRSTTGPANRRRTLARHDEAGIPGPIPAAEPSAVTADSDHAAAPSIPPVSGRAAAVAPERVSYAAAGMLGPLTGRPAAAPSTGPIASADAPTEGGATASSADRVGPCGATDPADAAVSVRRATPLGAPPPAATEPDSRLGRAAAVAVAPAAGPAGPAPGDGLPGALTEGPAAAPGGAAVAGPPTLAADAADPVPPGAGGVPVDAADGNTVLVGVALAVTAADPAAVAPAAGSRRTVAAVAVVAAGAGAEG